MDFRQDPPDSVIDEVASILATGYLRLRSARTLGESGGVVLAAEPHPAAAEQLESVPDLSPHGAVR